MEPLARPVQDCQQGADIQCQAAGQQILALILMVLGLLLSPAPFGLLDLGGLTFWLSGRADDVAL